MTLTLIDLGGAIALLLWGLHMVQAGVQRAFGAGLRHMLGLALGGRVRAFGAGLVMTAVLQSSTATALMIASFAGGGTIGLVPALAAMLGANVGTTLLVGALSFDATRMASIALLVGVLMFRRSTQTRTRDLGRVGIGLGLMLLSLHHLLDLLTPYEDVPSLRLMLGVVVTEPVIAVVAGALVTWLAHSSLAVVLLVMSLAERGVVSPDGGLALVLGANLGAALNPLLESATGEAGTGRRLPLGNALNRLVGCVLGLLLLDPVGRWLVVHVDDPAREIALFHLLYNGVLALGFFPVLGAYAGLLRRLLPARLESDPSVPLYLGRAGHETPSIALAGAEREALRMADVLERMLRSTEAVLESDDRKLVLETRRLDDLLDRLNGAIQTYLTALDPDALSAADHRRLGHIVAFTTNIEHAGDVLDRNVMSQAAKRLERGIAWQQVQRAGLHRGLELLGRNLRAAGAVLMTADVQAAQELVASKEAFRELEAQASAAHLACLRDGRPVRVEASTLFLDLMRDLNRSNGHLIAASAYPVLEAEGALLPNRLRRAAY